MNYIFCILIGYLLGSISPSYIISRLKGFDIRTRGSNNAGASNAMITMGWSIAAIVAIVDIAKTLASVYIAGALFPQSPYAAIVSGVACILGHIFPFYMKFKGGKGLAPYLGLILALDWKFFIITIIGIALITVITDYIVIGTFTTVIAYPLYKYLTHTDIIAVGIILIASIVVIYKHFTNIKRILKGEEIGLYRKGQQNK